MLFRWSDTWLLLALPIILIGSAGLLYERRKAIEPPKESLTVTRIEAATRQTEAAIEAFARGDFDIAITLAGAAEGMIQRDGPHMFSFLRDSPRVKDVPKKDWIAVLNAERDWLKHESPLDVLIVEKETAYFMIARAASKLENWTPRIYEFKDWIEKEVSK